MKMASATSRTSATRSVSKTRARKPLTSQAILKAALKLVDKEGVDGFSMRRLGQVLNVKAMSIYHYFPNKDAILDDMIDLIYIELYENIKIESLKNESPHVVISNFIDGFRDVWRKHPKAFRLLAQRPVVTTRGRQNVEVFMNALVESGLSKEGAIFAYRTILCFASGFILLENAGVSPLYTIGDFDREYSVGLDIILSGIEQRLRPNTGGAVKANGKGQPRQAQYGRKETRPER